MKVKAIKGKEVERISVDLLKYDEYVGAIIAADVYGHNHEYTAMVNLGWGSLPDGETEGGVWAIDKCGNVYWLHHTDEVYLLNVTSLEE